GSNSARNCCVATSIEREKSQFANRLKIMAGECSGNADQPATIKPMTLRRRRLWFVLLAGWALAGGVGAGVIATAGSTKDAERITKGMPREKVHAILGKPMYDCIVADHWEVSDGMIQVQYDENDSQHPVTEKPLVFSMGVIEWQWHQLLDRL